MIRYFSHNQVDKSKWDTCVKKSVNGIIYAYSWYLDIVCPGWDALVEDDYKSLMPLPHAEKYRFQYTYPPPFTQQLGVFSTSKLTGERVNDFLNAIPDKFRYIEMNLNIMNRTKQGEFEERQLVTHLLDLIPSYKHIFSNYSTQTKRNLKKALSSSLHITDKVTPKKIIELFRDNKGKEFKHPEAYYEKLLKLMNVSLRRNSAQCLGAYTKDKELCAGAFFMGSNRKVIFLFSGANRQAYESQAMTCIIDKFIQENSQRELTLDFEGSMDPDIARFYKGFGSNVVHFQQVRKNNLPYPVKWIKEIQFKKNAAQGRKRIT